MQVHDASSNQAWASLIDGLCPDAHLEMLVQQESKVSRERIKNQLQTFQAWRQGQRAEHVPLPVCQPAKHTR